MLESNDVKVIPEKYILRRWTIEVHYGIVHDFRGKKIEGEIQNCIEHVNLDNLSLNL